MMRDMILAALLSAGVSSGGTYAVMRSHAPTQDDRVVLQLQKMNVALDQIMATELRGQAMQMAAYQALAENANRQLIVGRLIAQGITGKDPLPILQQAKAPEIGVEARR